MPSARPARRIAVSPIGCPCAASPARSLAVTSGWPGRQPSAWAQAARAGPRAIASTHPLPPHTHGGPSGSTTTWPMWPALPVAPLISLPSSTSPPPTPVNTTMPSIVVRPRPAPRQCSPTAKQIASLCSRTESPSNRSRSRSRSGNACQAGMFSGETFPAGHSIGPPQPHPTPASAVAGCTSASASTRVTSASSVRHSCSASSSRGVAVCDHEITRPPGSTSPAANFVPPMSMASAGYAAVMSATSCAPDSRPDWPGVRMEPAWT